MTGLGQNNEKEYGLADPVVAVQDTNYKEPLDINGEGKGYIQITAQGEPSSHGGSEIKWNEKVERPDFDRTKSYMTDASIITRTDSYVNRLVKKRSNNDIVIAIFFISRHIYSTVVSYLLFRRTY